MRATILLFFLGLRATIFAEPTSPDRHSPSPSSGLNLVRALDAGEGARAEVAAAKVHGGLASKLADGHQHGNTTRHCENLLPSLLVSLCPK